MYGEKQIISPLKEGSTQANGIPNTPPPPFSSADYSYPVKGKIVTGVLDLIMPFVTFSALFGIISFLFYEGGIGITGCYLAFLGFTTVYIVTKQKHFPLKALYPLTLCIITAMTYSLRYSEVLGFTVPLLFYFSGLYCMSLTDTKGADFYSYLSIYDQLKGMILLPHLKLFLPVISLWNNRKTGIKGLKIKKSSLGVLFGILCGLPVFIIVANLLIEGDAAFSGVMNGVTDKITDIAEKLFDKLFGFIDDPLMIMIALVFTPWVTATVFSFRHGVIKQALQKSESEASVRVFRFVNDGILGGFYGIIALCYVIYLISQFSYLFGAFSGNIPLSVNISLSEYARRGFFEMSTVAVINLCLIGAGVLFSKRDEKGSLSRLCKGFAAFFSIFTLILIATAMSKMGLYIGELGLTEKRILVSLADIVLALTFTCILVRLFKKSFPYMKIIMYTALTLITLYCALSPDLMIARYNTEAYLSGRHKNIDLYTITYLSDSYEALRAFDRLKDCENEVVCATAKNEIYDIYESYKTYGLNSFCLNEKRAEKYLKENEEVIKSYERFSYYDVHYEYDIDRMTEQTKENGELFEVFETKISLTLNTDTHIYGVYFHNDYSDFSVLSTDKESTVTFKWNYSDNIKDVFAEVNVDGEAEYRIFTLMLEKDANGKVILKDEYHFELSDGENGELILTST